MSRPTTTTLDRGRDISVIFGRLEPHVAGETEREDFARLELVFANMAPGLWPILSPFADATSRRANDLGAVMGSDALPLDVVVVFNGRALGNLNRRASRKADLKILALDGIVVTVIPSPSKGFLLWVELHTEEDRPVHHLVIRASSSLWSTTSLGSTKLDASLMRGSGWQGRSQVGRLCRDPGLEDVTEELFVDLRRRGSFEILPGHFDVCIQKISKTHLLEPRQLAMLGNGGGDGTRSSEVNIFMKKPLDRCQALIRQHNGFCRGGSLVSFITKPGYLEGGRAYCDFRGRVGDVAGEERKVQGGESDREILKLHPDGRFS